MHSCDPGEAPAETPLDRRIARCGDEEAAARDGPAAAGATTAGLAGRDYLRYPANVADRRPSSRPMPSRTAAQCACRYDGALLAIAVAAVVQDRSEGAALASAAELLGGHAGSTTFRYGAWHGDWAPWNMANLADALLVWDWERFATGVPVGFDAVHHDLQRRIQSSGDAAGAVESTVRAAGELLAPVGVSGEAREMTALLYLVDLATRYLTDRQAEAGARLGVLGTWLLPVLIRRVEEL